jgi:hypothetical protein
MNKLPPTEHLRHLTSTRVRVDDIWAFNYCKARAVPTAKPAPEQAGDIWTKTAIDADTKLAMSWLIDPRNLAAALLFMDDLAELLFDSVQLTSDLAGSQQAASCARFCFRVPARHCSKHRGTAGSSTGTKLFVHHGRSEPADGAVNGSLARREGHQHRKKRPRRRRLSLRCHWRAHGVPSTCAIR